MSTIMGITREDISSTFVSGDVHEYYSAVTLTVTAVNRMVHQKCILAEFCMLMSITSASCSTKSNASLEDYVNALLLSLHF